MAKSGRRAKNGIGIWIDHKEAVLVATTGEGPAVERIESHAEAHFRPSGGWKSAGTSVAQAVSKEKNAEERRRHQLHAFYLEVIGRLAAADALYVLGPGQAKLELVKELEKAGGAGERIAAVEACDRLTERQLVAKVKAFFLGAAKRAVSA